MKVTLQKRPAAQRLGDDEPRGQNWPSLHLRHSLEPPGLEKPAAHFAHIVSFSLLQ
jgi:hypothetical protein